MQRVLLTLTFLSLLGLTQLAVAAQPPNVVLIISDDQAWSDFGFMDHPVIQTPRLDRLASESLLYTRGYVPSSLCRPSLATLATGLFPHQHRITSNDPARALPREEFLRQRFEQIANIDRVPTLAGMLGERGYVSFQTGKWWEGNPTRGGFTGGMTHGDPTRGGRHGDEGLKIGREGMQPIYDFIEDAGDRPFFLWHAPFLPHSPHNPPERLLAKYEDKTDSIHIARYWAMCEWFDETCGELLDYLDDNDLSKDTLVVFVVDNGWIQQPDSRAYADRSKRSQYDGGLRTPIMFRQPGKIAPRRDDRLLANSVDLVPTILQACGLEPTADMQGIDLLDAEAVADRKIIFGEIFEHNAVDIRVPASSLDYRWCIEGRWKLVLPCAANVPDGEVELFDVLADPFEKNNLAGTSPERVVELTKKINAWWPGK